MKTVFRPWHTEEDTNKLIAYAEQKAKGNKVTSIIVKRNIYGDDMIEVCYITQTEKQKKYGFFDNHYHRCLLWKLPKKYQPHIV